MADARSRVQVDSGVEGMDLNAPAILACIKETHSELGLKQEAAAAIAGVAASQYSDALNGKGRYAVTWLEAQDDDFRARVVEKLKERWNLTPENVSAIRRKRIVELVDLLLTECA